MLLATTTIAGVGGYLRYQVEEERRDKVRFESPGPVESRKYWPPPAVKLVDWVEEKFGPRDGLRLYRNHYSRRFGITDCFLQFSLSPAQCDKMIAGLKIELLDPDDRYVDRFWRKAPEGWLSPEDVPGATIYGTPYVRGGHMGSQPYVLYDQARGMANVWYVYDY